MAFTYSHRLAISMIHRRSVRTDSFSPKLPEILCQKLQSSSFFFFFSFIRIHWIQELWEKERPVGCFKRCEFTARLASDREIKRFRRDSIVWLLHRWLRLFMGKVRCWLIYGPLSRQGIILIIGRRNAEEICLILFSDVKRQKQRKTTMTKFQKSPILKPLKRIQNQKFGDPFLDIIELF